MLCARFAPLPDCIFLSKAIPPEPGISQETTNGNGLSLGKEYLTDFSIVLDSGPLPIQVKIKGHPNGCPLIFGGRGGT